MRTLQVLLFLILSIFWQPSAAFATVQTVQPTAAITQQATPTTTLKQNRTEKKIKQFFAKKRGSGFDMGGDSKWLWWGIGFLLIAWLINSLGVSLLSLVAGVLGIVAVVCLVMWVLKFFNIM
jgi:Flp pilus assembly protein TadB